MIIDRIEVLKDLIKHLYAMFQNDKVIINIMQPPIIGVLTV